MGHRTVFAAVVLALLLTSCDRRAPTVPPPSELLTAKIEMEPTGATLAEIETDEADPDDDVAEPAQSALETRSESAMLMADARTIIQEYYPASLRSGATEDATIVLVVREGAIIASGTEPVRIGTDSPGREETWARIWPSEDEEHGRWMRALNLDFEPYDPPIERVDLSRHPAGTVGGDAMNLVWLYLGSD